MMPQRRTFAKKTFAVAIVLAVILSVDLLYFNGLTTQVTQANAATISSLRSSISRLEATNQVLATSTGPSSLTSPTLVGINSERIYADTSQSVVTVQGDALVTTNTVFGLQTVSETVLGSGFVTLYQNSPYVITNYHVVQGVENLSVTFRDGNAYPGRIVGSDPYSDLAVVSTKAPPSDYIPLQVVPSTNARVGEPVVAIGNPFGLSGSITYGIISQLGRTLQDPTAGNFSISDVIQFSAPINPGNSGGPLLDANGTVIGITTAVVSGSQGLGFAIPSDTIMRELPSLVSTGSYMMHSYLGISGVDMNYELARVMGTNVTYGVLLENVLSNGPAAAAGLRAGSRPVSIGAQQYLVGGDIIVSINGTRVVNQDALSTYLATSTTPSQVVQIGIIRDGNLTTVNLTLGVRPPPPSR